MSIETERDLIGLTRAGRVVALALRAMREHLRPGLTTAELDAVAAAVFAAHGARSAPQLVYGFPGVTCISLNDEAVHGIPGARVIEDGDLVKLDVTVELDGFYADACRTVAVGDARPQAARLGRTAEQALAGLCTSCHHRRWGIPPRPENEAGISVPAWRHYGRPPGHTTYLSSRWEMSQDMMAPSPDRRPLNMDACFGLTEVLTGAASP